MSTPAGALRLEDGSGLVAALAALQRRTILPYDNAAQRAEQNPNPPIPLVTFLRDVKRFEWWNGIDWLAFGADAALAARVTALEGRMTAVETVNATQDGKIAALEARPVLSITGGVTAITTGAEGLATIAHGLGVVPRTVIAVPQYQVLGGGAITDISVIDPGPNASTFSVRMANNHGDFLNSASLAVWWIALA